MSKGMNRYQKVLKIAKIAQEMEEEIRYPIEDKKNAYIKEVNKSKARNNYVLDAFEQITNEENDDAC